MACQAMYTWSLSGLVGAFVDLSISYLLLCASAIAFTASKFLGVFGLYLPCPCDGLFFLQPSRNFCFHKLFIDYPAEKVSNVQLSIRSKFPFNEFQDQNCNMNFRLVGEKESDVIELEGEASCSSVSDSRKPSNFVRIKGELNERNEVGRMKLLGGKEGRFDLKGKEIMHQKSRSGLRHRRKGSFNHGKYSSRASYDPRFSKAQGDPESPPSISKGGNGLAADDIMVLDNGNGSHSGNYHEDATTAMRFGRRHSNSINESPDEDETIAKNVSFLRELKGSVETGQSSSDDKYTIRLLEQALEEEHAARAALYHELDKERISAATAADEAMAMIQRLQEEKAAIEMESRQYKRLIEEKSAYDAEEMNILKEIVIRREREKHFLEKEVEVYRQMLRLGNEQQATENIAGMLDSQAFDSLLNSNEDPVMMLRHLSASIDKKNGAIGASKDSSVQGDENAARLTGDLPQFSVGSNDENQELKDKMVPIDNNSCAPLGNMTSVETLTWSSKVSSSVGKLPEENISLIGKRKEQVDRDTELLEKNFETSHIVSDFSSLEQSEKDTNQRTKTSCNSSNKEPCVHDVHVIDQSNSYNQISGGKEARMPKSSTPEIHMIKEAETSVLQRVTAIRDTPTPSNMDVGVGINRSTSDTTSRLPPIVPKGKSVASDLRRNSLSAVDNERLKLDIEIGRLRERLKIVQEGREKLNLSVEHKERENLQLKLLEDIAHQLQELRQLKEPGKAVRQASLPLPSSKSLSEGTDQFPDPPIIAGITIKRIIKKA
ncbi:hypothetical protein M9H77_36639 [Catharanthus roseus]|uniref:Uncharacterized protein n=1 Tax=Catharanthus roseus TaxID=4058 RepID=A0ACB9ZTD5_CATRO|nr:hypothetical protein M9H77_36639 [Catharanthus roseus]